MNPSMNVLYVEDDVRSRRVMELLLKHEMGLADVTLFSNSENFVERLLALDPMPTLILLDIHVPPYDGFAMLAMLRELPRFATTPIVALTASVMNEEVDQLKSAGFDSVIAKPIDIEVMPTLLKRIMAGERIWNIVEAI